MGTYDLGGEFHLGAGKEILGHGGKRERPLHMSEVT